MTHIKHSLGGIFHFAIPQNHLPYSSTGAWSDFLRARCPENARMVRWIWLHRHDGFLRGNVAQHLTGLLDAKVKVTIEIEAELPSGAPENVVRTVTENCRTLKFDSQGFEET